MNESKLTLSELVALFRKHRRTMAICFGAIMVGAVLLAMLLPNKYESEAQLLVRLGRENMRVDPTATLSGTQTRVMSTGPREQEVNTVAAIMRNRSLLMKVVDSVGYGKILDRDDDGKGKAEVATMGVLGDVNAPAGQVVSMSTRTPRDKAVRVLEKNLEVEAVRNTNLVRITFQSYDPQVAQKVISDLVNFYLDEHARIYRTPGAHKFLLKQTAEMRERLRASEVKLRDRKSETGLVATEPQRLAVVERIAKLQNEASEVEAAISETEAHVRHLRKALEGLSKTEVTEERTGNNGLAAGGMRQELYRLQLRAQELSATYTDKHIKVKQIREQVAAAQKVLANEEKTTRNTTLGNSRMYEETQLQLVEKEPLLTAMKAKSAVLEQQLIAANQELQELNTNEVLLAGLEREVQINDSNYRIYATDTEQARIDHVLNSARMSNISVVQPPTLNASPRFPNVTVIFAMGLIVASFGCAGSAFFAESLEGRTDSSTENNE